MRWNPRFRADGVREVRAQGLSERVIFVKVTTTMARLTRLMMVLSFVIGFSAIAPNSSQAGVIPWVYDAIFGPVGSLRNGGGGYAPGYAVGYGGGYGGYGMAYSGYTPTTVAYAPTTAAYGGSYGSNCGCSTSNYPSTVSYDSYAGSSSCSSCSSGTVGGSSQTTRYGSPTADPNNYSRDVLHRLDELEYHQKQIIKFLEKRHPEDFRYDPYTRQNSTYRSNLSDPARSETVPARERVRDTFGTDPNNFVEPKRRTLPDGEESRKIELNPPPTDADGTKTAPDKSNEAEPQAQRFDRRITTRAVAPKERISTAAAQSKTKNVANSNGKRSKAWLDSSNANELARH